MFNLPAWSLDIAGVSAEDESLPSEINGINLVLNRMRLARFLAEFADDQDVQNLLGLDALSSVAGLPLSSTGLPEALPSLALRPFRLWEYAWLFQTLSLSAGGIRVLDLGGPATPLTMLAALSGCRVSTLDINSEFVSAARECAHVLQIDSLEARVGDMRDLGAFTNDSFDVVLCCSVLEHLTGQDQEIALREMGRVLRPGGLIGLTFDFGRSAPGGSVYLPPPHDPPPNAAEAVRRFTPAPLVPVGNSFEEDPALGSLFRHESILYTVASLFLAKPPAPSVRLPRSHRLSRSSPGALRIADMPQRLHQRALQLESLLQGEAYRIAANERLTALVEKEAVIHELDAALRENRAQLEERWRQEERCSKEQRLLQDRNAMLQARIDGFEKESWTGCVKRRLGM